MARTTPAHLQRPLTDVAGDPMRLFQVGPNWPRTSWQQDPVSGLWYPGALLELARSQICAYSRAHDSWATKLRCTVPTTDDPAPDGTPTADVLHEDNTASNSHYIGHVSTEALAIGTYAISTIAEPINRSQIGISIGSTGATIFDLAAGTVVSEGAGLSGAQCHPYGNNRYRVRALYANSSGIAQSIYLFICEGGNLAFSGLDQDSLRVWGSQIEAGPYESSIIINDGTSTVQRTADSKIEWLTYVPDEFSVQYLFSIPEHIPPANISVSYLYVDANNFLVVRFKNTGELTAYTVVGGFSEAIVTPNVIVTDGKPHRAVLSYRRGRLALHVDGVGAEDSGAHLPGMDRIQLYPSGALVSMQWRNEWLTGQPRPVQPDMLLA